MTKRVNLARYDMSSFLESCVDAYCELAKVKKDQLPNVATPFTGAGIARPTLDDKEIPGRLQPIAGDFLHSSYGPARSLEGNPKSSLSCNQVVSRV